jgi:hypothetical protein
MDINNKVMTKQKLVAITVGIRGNSKGIKKTEVIDFSSAEDYMEYVAEESESKVYESFGKLQDSASDFIAEWGIGGIKEYKFRESICYVVVLNEEEELYIFERDLISDSEFESLEKMTLIKEINGFLNLVDANFITEY